MTRLILLLFFYSYSFALNIDDNTNHYDKFNVSILFADRNSTLVDVKNLTFKPSHNNFALGYHKQEAWFKIDFQNNSQEQNFILTTNEFFYENATLYYENEGRLIEKNNSLFTPLNQREVESKNIAFAFAVPSNYKGTLYLRVWGKFSYFGQIDIYKEKAFYKRSVFNIETFIFFILGAIVTIAIFNLFLYRYLKNRLFLYYTFYVLFLGVYFLNITGFFVYVDMQKYLYILQLSASMAHLFLLLFVQHYFETKQRTPLDNKILNIFIISIGLLLVGMMFFYAPLNKVLTIVVGLSAIFLFYLPIKIYFRGFKKIKFFFLAILLFLIGIFVLVTMLSGLSEYSFMTRYGFIVASFFEIIIFSLLLSEKYNEIQKEKLTIQEQLINEQEHSKQRLEIEVQERTAEIEQNYKDIAKLSDERALLLKEVHHRVKNNFQTVMSMLWFENKKEQNQRDFTALANRIKSMASVHEFIYNTNDLSLIETEHYLKQVVENLILSYPKQNKEIRYDIQSSLLNINTAISIGIILNELITNSIKHAGSSKCEVNISFRVYADKKVLLVRDNNKEFEDKGQLQQGIGLEMIHDFSQKIPNSRYSLSHKFGTEYILEL